MKKIFITFFTCILIVSMIFIPTANDKTVQATTNTIIQNESEPNDDFNKADYLKLGENYSMQGTLEIEDADFYKVTIPTSGELIVLGVKFNINSSPFKFNLVDEKNAALNSVAESENEKGTGKVYNVTPGVYYIAVYDHNNIVNGVYGIRAYMNKKDVTPPKTLTVNKVTSKTSTITGKTEAKAIVEIKFGSKLLGKAIADSKGNFKVKIKTQKKGSKLTVIAKDQAGNAKKATITVKTLTIEKDTTPPKTLTVNKVTSKTTTITGKTEAKAIVEVKSGSKLLGKAIADSKGNFKVKIKSQVNGSKLTVIAKDKAGNAKKVTITVKNPYYNPVLGGVESVKFKGVTVKAGMTKKQIINLLGKPGEIREPMGGTINEREYMKQVYGEELFNFSDIEQWSYLDSDYKAIAIFFDYQDHVREIISF